MKKIKVRFERDWDLEHIDVVVRASVMDAAVTRLMEQISKEPLRCLDVTSADGIHIKVVVDDIISISVRGKQTLLVTESARHTLRQALHSLESELDPAQFLRISRHELINMDKIEQYEFTGSGTLRLVLSGGVETWASRRCIPAIRDRIGWRG